MESMDISSVLLYMNSCSQCQMAKNSGVESFIAHLASVHSIPTEWPSDRAARLTGAEAKKPYTTVAATRKKRRKLTTPRPLNSFMVSSCSHVSFCRLYLLYISLLRLRFLVFLLLNHMVKYLY